MKFLTVHPDIHNFDGWEYNCLLEFTVFQITVNSKKLLYEGVSKSFQTESIQNKQ